MSVFKESNGAVSFVVRVVSRANQNQFAGIEADALKIRLSAPPVEGKANLALIDFLAQSLGVARMQIEIVRGHAARRKLVRVRGITAKQMEDRLK